MRAVSISLALLLAVACGDSGSGTAPSPDPGASGASGGDPGDGDNESGAGGGAAGETSGAPGSGGVAAGAGGEPGAQAGETYELAGAPSLPPLGACAPDLMLDENVSVDVSVPGGAEATLLSMTPDELSVAFSTGSDDELALYVADRDSADASFTPELVVVPSGYEAASGVALSSDGLRLLLVSHDHSAFGELSRSARRLPFDADPNTGPYAKLNALKPMSGRSLGWPVLSNDGQSLYFLSYFGQGLVNQSRLDQDGVFDFGKAIDEFTLGGQEGAYKLPSGISADERAIFVFDQATEHMLALFRSRPDAPFYDPLDLGERRGVAPNLDCSRLYSSDGGELVMQARH